MRVTVMGSGGTGGYFGGLLARADEDVTFVARGANLQALRSKGLTVRSRLVGNFAVPARATDDPGEAGPADLVLFRVKAYDTESAAERLRRAVGPNTVILPVQNGIDSAERIGRVIGPGHVIGGLAAVSSAVQAPGIIEHRAGPDAIQLGELDGQPTARTQRVADVLRQAGDGSAAYPPRRISPSTRPSSPTRTGRRPLRPRPEEGPRARSRSPRIGPIDACYDGVSAHSRGSPVR